jgi:hypothetical protein
MTDEELMLAKIAGDDVHSGKSWINTFSQPRVRALHRYWLSKNKNTADHVAKYLKT